MEDEWYEQQIEGLSDALQELLSADDLEKARQGLSDAIASWTDYHEKELAKWKAFKVLLGL